MARNTGDILDIARPLGGDAAPARNRRLTKAKPQGKPRDQAALSTNEIHSGHADRISPLDKAAQATNIAACDDESSDTEVMDLGGIIQQARKRADLTQVQLAKVLRVQQSAISQWESGRSVPELENRIRLAGVLNIPLQDLLPEAGAAVSNEDVNSPGVRELIQNYLKLPQQVQLAVRLQLQLLLAQRDQDD